LTTHPNLTITAAKVLIDQSKLRKYWESVYAPTVRLLAIQQMADRKVKDGTQQESAGTIQKSRLSSGLMEQLRHKSG
jgi:hypothetical protein